ncbi:helix-hairpin-helix domain-containing protein [Ferruginibacter paludis]|uniref:ComEA family DNA-binding protein n=1 Tax=Ferruginibacter paludis TaxID=1310417 RepID=UPI0025B2C638|nr:helix-hairpin-helix domain-containing protein [Ferruginibacter paludis]MDN3658713.1 helix-hairpin-helix domain-containing protein [Ferruginibacter paludis]
MIRLKKNGGCILPAALKVAGYSLLIGTIILLPELLIAQTPEIPSNIAEQQLEAITENNDDNETEDDSFLQSMQQFLKDPINLNTADAEQLKELMILSPLQIQNLISYRNLLGNFINLYELQAVPGWNIITIQKLRLFITVSNKVVLTHSLNERLHNGSNTILVRASEGLEKSKGYRTDATTAHNFYPGSPQKVFVRYKYQYKNLLQYGLLAEKDAGEQFFKGAQKNGFDFYSAHLFARNIGVIKQLALGDFTVNMGQGLTQWQSLAFKKSADITNIKRQLAILRPYNSAGEINFHRGVGITIGRKNWETTVFASLKNVDGNFALDTINTDGFITSLQTSGLHRTSSETADKGIQQQLAFGGNLAYNKNIFHVGVNGIQYHFRLPINKEAVPYNLYALSGNTLGNYSIDYSYTFKNMHFFGEAAVTNNFAKAFVNGLLISVDANVDLSFLYRNISEKYHALYSSAFTENSTPVNEKGMFGGISIRPTNFWRIDVYADLYKFPWLKYLTDAPSAGADYMLQATYKPNKQLEWYVRYHAESKSKNFNPDLSLLSLVVNKPKQNFRTQVNYKINSAITFRNRVEMVWYNKKGQDAQNGFLSFADILYKPALKNYSAGMRMQYFETGGYESRLYAYENDVLYSYSIPVFYDKGFRYYLNFNYDLNKQITVWIKWGQSIYQDKTSIGSGLDEIPGNKKSEIKMQLQYRF